MNTTFKKYYFLFVLLWLAVGCSEDENNSTAIPLMEVSHTVNFFTFTPDTGNDTFRLQYEITFTNPNDIPIKGFYRITTDADGLVTTRLSTNFSPCYDIAANSSCTINFDEEDSFDIGRVNSITLISVEYNIDNE